MSNTEEFTSGDIRNQATEIPTQNMMVFPPELAAQFAEFLKQSSLKSEPTNEKPPPPPPPYHPHHPESLGEITVKPKLNGENYPLWSNLMDRGIGGKGLSSHIDGVTAPPARTDPFFPTWQQRDHCVFNWIINNIETDLINEVSQYATAYDLWEGLAITYGSGGDPLQIYDLHRQTNTVRQEGASLEAIWNKFQGLWISIDRRELKPMDKQTLRLYQFLTALDDKYDAIKKEILRRDPLPTVREAYGIVRRESNNDAILGVGSGGTVKDGIGSGLAAIDRGRPTPPPTTVNRPWNRRSDEDKSRLTCSHCGGKRHTKDGCFHLIGFPDWWDELKKARAMRSLNRNGGGRAAVAMADRAADTGKPAGSTSTAGQETAAAGGAVHVDEPAKAAAARVVWEGGSFSSDLIPHISEIVNQPQTSHKSRPAPPNSRYFWLKPHEKWNSHIHPHNSGNYQNNPTSSCASAKTPSNYPEFEINPNIPCHNKFQALAHSSLSGKQHKEHEWIFDCGATDTMSYELTDFTNISVPHKKHVQTANGSIIPVQGAGTIKITPTLQISNCLYVPLLAHKLLSVSHVTRELQCKLLMEPDLCVLQDIKTGMTVGRGTEQQGLYYVDKMAQPGTAMLTHGTTESQGWLWHRRLGHPSIGYMRMLFPDLASTQLSFNCDTCFFAKSHRHSYKLNNSRVDTTFSLIHSDVWGPVPVLGSLGFKYFLLFIDDCTRLTWVYFLRSKSDVFEKFTLFYNMVHTQYNKQIKILRSDNGGEFVNSKMQQFFSERGLVHQTTCPHTPEQNGVAERKNRKILEMTRALLIDSHVPKTFWPEAVATSVYLLNRLPTHILNFKTPFDVFSTQNHIPPPLTLKPKIFGCSVFVHIPKHDRTKFSPCSVKCVFVGYGKDQKGYRCYDPKTKRLYVTMNCDFVENEYFYNQPSGQGEEKGSEPVSDPLSWSLGPNPDRTLTPDQNPHTPDHTLSLLPLPNPVTEDGPTDDASCGTTGPSSSHNTPCEISEPVSLSDSSTIPEVSTPENDSISQLNTNHGRQENEPSEEPGVSGRSFELPPRSTRGVPPKRYSPDWKGRKTKYSMANLAVGHLTEMARAFEVALYEEDLPRSAEEAMKHQHWREAMKKEMDALLRNNTWEKSSLPEGKKPVGCRWVFTIKRRADGSIERYKARLVAKGYTQTYGIDYEETFSPVAKMNTVRTLLSVAACKDWKLHQFDVTNAFLHGELKKDEEVYMEVPPGYSNEFNKGQVCRLKKTLYGLKQSPRVWFGRFSQAMNKYGYSQSQSDHTLFIKRRGDRIACLIIYVDDMIITGDDEEEIEDLKKNLSQEFEMKDLGALKYFLGIEVLRSREGIFLRQKKYVLDLLAETGLLDCKPADIPLMVNHGLKFEEGAKLANREEYQRLVGKLIYLAHTRPDISYAVGVISQFMHKPQENHMDAALRVVRYLKGTAGYGVLLRKNDDLEVDGFTDADWASNPIDRKSTGGYFTFVGGNLVTWKSKKQKVVALSSAEAEFRGIKSGLTEIMWLRRLLTEIGLPPKRRSQLFCDNKAAISISENPVQHDRTKHVEVDRHFIKEKIEGGIIEFPFVRSEDQLADILTKAVNPKMFNEVLSKLSIGDAVAQLEGECHKDLP